MHRFLEYSIFFVALVLLQVFLFNNLNLSVYIHPLVYVAFVLLLPVETMPVVVLMYALLTGVAVDLMSGEAGLNTIALLATAFARRPVLAILLGKEAMSEGGVPCSGRIGTGRFLRYAALLMLVHCLVYFTFEALTFNHYYITLLKAALSAAASVVLIFFSQFLLGATYGAKSSDNR